MGTGGNQWEPVGTWWEPVGTWWEPVGTWWEPVTCNLVGTFNPKTYSLVPTGSHQVPTLTCNLVTCNL